MKLEIKLGSYAIVIVLLALTGFIVMLYPFEYYSELNKTVGETNPNTFLFIVFGTKAIGVLLLHVASEMYNKHFKSKRNDQRNN